MTASKDAALVNFVRPGLTIAIQNAKVTSDGTISVDYKLLDPKGQPLDLYGLTTPGAVSLWLISINMEATSVCRFGKKRQTEWEGERRTGTGRTRTGGSMAC